MPVLVSEWLELMDREYLGESIKNGGAAVKFVVANDQSIGGVTGGLAAQAARHELAMVNVDSATTKLHMIHDLFFAIARQIAWEEDAQRFVEELFRRNGYSWPSAGDPVPLKVIASHNKLDENIMRREFNQWLTADLMHDTRMAQDFRIALMQLCLNRLAPAEPTQQDSTPILQWMRGELRTISALKSAQIFTKINRHNARAMLRSLCRWLVLAGHRGLLLTIDINQLMRTAANAAEGVRYSTATVMDAYEVLRQMVDDADLFEHFFVVVLADYDFIGEDRKRSVDAYQALKMRIWNEVRARDQDNPLAPLVFVTSSHQGEDDL